MLKALRDVLPVQPLLHTGAAANGRRVPAQESVISRDYASCDVIGRRRGSPSPPPAACDVLLGGARECFATPPQRRDALRGSAR